jgi:O-antigen ligase
MLNIAIFLKRKINPWIYVVLIGGILSTGTRSAFASLFILLIMVFILRKKKQSKKLMAAFVVFVILITGFLSITLPNVDSLGHTKSDNFNFRDYARVKGINIWSDHFLIGVGPGMFGGVISKMFVSKVYREYNFNFEYLVAFVGGIDQYWPQLLAEIGIIGFILFICIIIAVVILLLRLRHEGDSNDIKYLQTGLLVFLITIYVYTLGTGFNTTAVIFPYFAFIGISLGYVTDLNRRKMDM